MLNNSLKIANNVLEVIGIKQEAIAENLANVNTPGYQRRNVNFADYMTTHNNPLETKLSEKLGPSRTWIERDGEVAPAQELMDMNKTQVFYTVATRQMTSVIQQLKQVTQVGR